MSIWELFFFSFCVMLGGSAVVPGGGGGGNGTPSQGHLVDVVVAGAVQISQGEVGAGRRGNGS